MARRDKEFHEKLTNAGINTSKDFYEHDLTTQSKIEEIRKQSNFSGKNSLGRSPNRQFYYAAQRGRRISTSAKANAAG